ncbi:MAG: triple tyrosine motif-containing protein [Ignavibacteriales bacterium]|nr:triple tyrosine motif-containing protein [Ignavibacteriales bacterium]
MKPGLQKNTFIILLILSLVSTVLRGQSTTQHLEYQFNQIKVEDGLSQSTVFCMLQDRKGFLWFGTANGLNRYDGYNFTVFTNDPNDTTTISDNGILSLLEDKDGFIWVGTVGGVLNKYDRKNGTFTRYNFTEYLKTENDLDEKYYDFPLPFSRNNNKSITVIEQDDKSMLWIGTWGKGLIKFDPVKNTFEHFHSDKNQHDGLQSNRIKAIVPVSDGTVWVGTLGGGLYKLITRSNQIRFQKYEHNKNFWSLSDNKVISLFKDVDGNLWIGTYGGGLNKLTMQFQSAEASQARFERFMNDPQKNSLSNNIVTSIIQNTDRSLWLGTIGGGLDHFDLNNKKFTVYKNDPKIPTSLQKNEILSLLVDKSGTLWIGTNLGKGLSRLEPSIIKFGQINRDINGVNGLNDDVVWAISEDQNSVVWIGTYKGGLNKYDRKNGKFTFYKSDRNNKSTLSDNHIRSIVDDGNRYLWIGTYSGGLNKFNKSTGRSTRYTFGSNDSSNRGSNQVQAILIDREKNLWVGTFGGGLNKVVAEDLKTDNIRFENFVHNVTDPFSLNDDRVYCITEDRDGILWIGTFGGGLNKFDPKTKKFISYKNIPGDESSLADNRVMTIYEDNFSNLWIGSYGGGLQKFDKRTEKFKRFNKKNRLISSVVYGILEDNSNNLWMSTDDGLFKFSIATEIFTQYDLHDGLQSSEFSGGAYFKSKQGEMFFGGINGFNYFYPDSVKDNLFTPPIVISNIKIFSNPVRGEIDSLELSYSQNFFSFEFAALDFTNPVDNQYAYTLEGLDSDWHYVDSRRRIVNYSNLSPGEYIFRVRGSNNDGAWNNDGAKIFIKIFPPIWMRWWFITVVLSFIAFLIFYLSTVRFRSLLAIEKLKGKLAADLHDNVGSGLTEISILSELTSQKINNAEDGSSQNLSAISEKARQLIDSMSDIVWMVNPQRDSFHHLIMRLKDTYSDLLYSSEISFRTINLEKLSSLKLPMEYKQNMYLIFKEGINNAIKHSKCKKIVLEADLNKDTIVMVLKDDGLGFDVENAKLGNGLLNMRKRADSIGCELIIDSSEEGTSLKFIGKLGGIKKVFLSFMNS